MGVRNFERVYFDLYYDDEPPMIQPTLRISHNEGLGSLAIQEAQPYFPLDAWERAYWRGDLHDDLLSDYAGWGEPVAATIADVLQAIEAHSDNRPLPLSLLEDAQEAEGDYYDGRSAKAFRPDEEIGTEDLALISYEDFYDGDWLLPAPFRSYVSVDWRGEGMVGLFDDMPTANTLCEAISDAGTYTAAEACPTVDMYAPLSFAILREANESDCRGLKAREGDLILVGATKHRRHAEYMAGRIAGQPVIKPVRKTR